MAAKKVPPQWQLELEKLGGKALAEVITEMRNSQAKILSVMEGMDKRHTTSEIRIDKLFTGFPQGDLDGHSRYHDALIKATEERRRMWKNIAERTLTGLIWLVVLYIGSVFWRESSHAIQMMAQSKQGN